MRDYMLALNNHLQRNRQTGSLSWEFSEKGPQHQLRHYAYLKINGQLAASGEGTNRGDAKQAAAGDYLSKIGAL